MIIVSLFLSLDSFLPPVPLAEGDALLRDLCLESSQVAWPIMYPICASGMCVHGSDEAGGRAVGSVLLICKKICPYNILSMVGWRIMLRKDGLDD